MRTTVPGNRLHQEAIEFRLILAATYPFFLAAAAYGRVAPGRASRSVPTAPRSVFGEAHAMAVQAIPFAFMG